MRAAHQRTCFSSPMSMTDHSKPGTSGSGSARTSSTVLSASSGPCAVTVASGRGPRSRACEAARCGVVRWGTPPRLARTAAAVGRSRRAGPRTKLRHRLLVPELVGLRCCVVLTHLPPVLLAEHVHQLRRVVRRGAAMDGARGRRVSSNATCGDATTCTYPRARQLGASRLRCAGAGQGCLLLQLLLPLASRSLLGLGQLLRWLAARGRGHSALLTRLLRLIALLCTVRHGGYETASSLQRRAAAGVRLWREWGGDPNACEGGNWEAHRGWLRGSGQTLVCAHVRGTGSDRGVASSH